MAFNCHGRSVSRKDQLDKTYLASFYSSMSKIDEQYSEVYNNVARRFLKSGITSFDYPNYNKYFYKGDYMMHIRPNYSIFIRTSSKRTVRNEYGNDENIKGYFLSDGSTCINVTGEEYYNIMPLWDWTKLPGTTAPYIDNVPLQEKAWSTYGTSEMCGGISDSRYGAVMYKYYDSWNNINTGGSKGYFMFDKEVVCLGTGLNSDKQYQTNINQCYGKSDITVYRSDGGEREVYHNNTCLNANNIKAIYHNNIGYYIPGQQDVYIRQSTKDGNWNEINKSEKDSTITDCIFLVGIDHSVSDTGGVGSYMYTLVPGLSQSQFDNYLNSNNINVISNTEEVQAVENTEIGVIQVLFYSRASVQTRRYVITASAPCCLMIQYMDNNKLSVYASEPTQQNNLIDIDITDIKSNACKRENFVFENDGKTIHKIFDLNM